LFRNKKFENINFPDLTPYRLLEHKTGEKGLVDVLVPRFRSKFGQKWIQPRLKQKYIRANLDEIGSAIWLEINGERTIHEIAKIADDKFGDEIRPVYNRLAIFMKKLYQNGFIYFKELNQR
jgi:hypothetical protein